MSQQITVCKNQKYVVTLWYKTVPEHLCSVYLVLGPSRIYTTVPNALTGWQSATVVWTAPTTAAPSVSTTFGMGINCNGGAGAERVILLDDVSMVAI